MPTETRSTCCYCGVGCGVIIESDGDRITGVRGDPDHPANFGRLSTKGQTLHLTAAPAQRAARLLQPMRRPARGAEPQPLPWDTALDELATRLVGTVRDHGPDAVGLYISGQLLTEDYYVFNKLAKGLLGTNNIDTNSRLCMSSAVAGYKRTLGADAPPACYDDVDHADCLFFAGSNAAWAHPVLFRRIEAARERRPGMKIVVVDPRRTDTAELADLHLALQPGTDVMLFHGLLHIMLWEGWVDLDYVRAHTSGFDELKALVRDCTPQAVAGVCGLNADDLVTAARWFAGIGLGQGGQRGRTLSLYCQGLNQSASGTDKNAALINLHLACGQIGRPGAGPFSLTGQPNAMGGREVGGMANLLPAHRDLANPAHRAEVAAFWRVDAVPAQPGKTAVEMFEAAADGQIRLLWIACTNPAQSMPDQATVRRALERCEFVVVQEAFGHTATCAHADLLLPATSWGEKTGTVTNSERRISRVRPAVPPPGAARHDWAIVVDVARRVETALRPGRPSLFPYPLEHEPGGAEAGAEAIWREHRDSTRGRDLDITGLSWPLLDEIGPQQWPMPAGSARGRARLYEDGRFVTDDGRARFAAVPWRGPAEPRDARYPFGLNTGRLRDQWHGMSRTGLLGRLFGHVPEPALAMHPADMQRLRLTDGDLAHVTSRRGSIIVPVRADAAQGPMQVFLPMHWGGEFLGGRTAAGQPMAGVNALTLPAVCPTSRQPELKHAAVKVLRAELPWRLLAMAWLPEEALQPVRERLRRLAFDLPFAACVPFGHERQGLLLRAAAHETPPASLLEALEQALGLAAADAPRYVDARRGQRRTLRLEAASDGSGQCLAAFLLAGDIAAEAWMRPLLLQGAAVRRAQALLRPGAAAPAELLDREGPAPVARQVCACFNVGEPAIRRTLAGLDGTDTERLQALQARLRCGTNCGSCLPELRRLVRQPQPAGLPT